VVIVVQIRSYSCSRCSNPGGEIRNMPGAIRDDPWVHLLPQTASADIRGPQIRARRTRSYFTSVSATSPTIWRLRAETLSMVSLGLW
jgi:hypothetical protein